MDFLQSVLSKAGDSGLLHPLSLIMGDQSCARTLLYVNVLDGACIGVLVSKALSYVMVLGSMIYKFPIIMNIVKAGHAGGMSPMSLYAETSAYVALAAFSFTQGDALSTYADLFFVCAQNLIIVSFIWLWGLGPKPSERVLMSHIFMTFAGAGGFVALVRYMLENQRDYVVLMATVITCMARIPQIISNASATTAGVQSPFTVLNSVLGCAAKCFVHAVETKNISLFMADFAPFLLNLTIFVQILGLSEKDAEAKKKLDSKKKK